MVQEIKDDPTVASGQGQGIQESGENEGRWGVPKLLKKIRKKPLNPLLTLYTQLICLRTTIVYDRREV